jgi:DNA-binding transcriptional LysR family regulator
MHEINLRSVDLNLLTVFEAVYEEQSQVKAAERLGMT